MTQVHIELSATLTDLQTELGYLGLWENQRPSKAALASREPFCIDTLSLPQWLQFVFLERMQVLIDTHQPLPARCGIAPMTEMYFKDSPHDGAQVIEHLVRIDELVGSAHE